MVERGHMRRFRPFFKENVNIFTSLDSIATKITNVPTKMLGFFRQMYEMFVKNAYKTYKTECKKILAKMLSKISPSC
jgi:hypothetical protein